MKKELAKALIFWGISLLILLALIPIAGAENLYGSVIRIHVVANSDSEADQEVKLLVRDRLLEYSRENFSLSENREKAAKEVEKNMDEMTRVAKKALEDAGFDLPVTISLTEEYYPTRDYEALSLPAGNYLSLRVMIGEAKGKNWWCVLFPPMCLNSAVGTEDALLQAGMEEDNVKTVTRDGKKYRVRFKIVEVWEETKEKIREIF